MRLISYIPAHSFKKRLATLLVICSGFTIAMVFGVDAQTLRGIAPTINIATGVPGAEPTPVVNTSSQIRYRGLTYLAKITVRTVCPAQKFDLSVIATGSALTGHGSAVAVTLLNGMLAADFITSIPINSAQTTVTLQYTSAPHFADGTGTDTHTVTYTQVAQ